MPRPHADRAGIDPSLVEVAHRDTAARREGCGTYDSCTLPVGGEAVARCATKVGDTAKRNVAHNLERDLDEDVHDGNDLLFCAAAMRSGARRGADACGAGPSSPSVDRGIAASPQLRNVMARDKSGGPPPAACAPTACRSLPHERRTGCPPTR